MELGVAIAICASLSIVVSLRVSIVMYRSIVVPLSDEKPTEYITLCALCAC